MKRWKETGIDEANNHRLKHYTLCRHLQTDCVNIGTDNLYPRRSLEKKGDNRPLSPLNEKLKI